MASNSRDITFYLALASGAASRAERRSGGREALEGAARPRRRRDPRPRLRLLVPLALRYRRYGVPISDLVAEGSFGVALALRKFDPDRGVRFGTYASYWARAHILNASFNALAQSALAAAPCAPGILQIAARTRVSLPSSARAKRRTSACRAARRLEGEARSLQATARRRRRLVQVLEPWKDGKLAETQFG